MNSENPVTFEGNNNDLTAVAAIVSAGVALISCGTCGQGLYCLPFIPGVLGIIGLLSADASVDPERTRRFSWISLGIGGGLILLTVIFLAAIFLMYFSVFAAALSTQGGNFTP